MQVKIILADPSRITEAHKIREEVFHKEQGVAKEIDFDGQDESALQFLAIIDGQPVGTGRVRFPHSSKKAKIERMAILKQYRGKGLGKKIVEFIEQELIRRGIEEAYLESEVQAEGFYLRLGYEKLGEPFEMIGMPHVKMKKRLSNK